LKEDDLVTITTKEGDVHALRRYDSSSIQSIKSPEKGSLTEVYQYNGVGYDGKAPSFNKVTDDVLKQAQIEAKQVDAVYRELPEGGVAGDNMGVILRENSPAPAAGKEGGGGEYVNDNTLKGEGAEKASSGKIYTPVEYKGTVKVNGEVRDVSRRVYQRNDIDFYYVDTKTGKTNVELMLKNKPPIGKDGKQIELHHTIQIEVGPMVEIREITHEEYYSQLHGLVGKGESFRNNPILEKQYNNFRCNYWKWRAEQFLGGMKDVR
jgi:hypothetical protein